jgi:hypothetical protein
MLVCIAPPSFSQDLSRKITIVAHDVPLEQIIREIEKKGEIYFSYSPQSIPAQKLINIEANNKSIKYILRKVFVKNGIKYDLVENHIVLNPSRELSGEDVEFDSDAHYTISGYLKDQNSGEVLIGAHVYEDSTYIGTSTNAYGFYSLTLPSGAHRIIFPFLGYESAVQDIYLNGDKQLNHEWAEGHNTPFIWRDDVYMISGTHNVVASNGSTLSATATQALEFALNCYWIKSGVIEFQHSALPLIILDYGDGTCDDDATVTINGTTYNIKL